MPRTSAASLRRQKKQANDGATIPHAIYPAHLHCKQKHEDPGDEYETAEEVNAPDAS